MSRADRRLHETRCAWLKAAILLLILIYLVAGFYPFQLQTTADKRVDNGATLTADGVLHLPSPGIAYTPQPPAWLARAMVGASVEIILEVRPRGNKQDGPARIFTLSESTYRRDLTVAQYAEHLIVRVRSATTDDNGLPSYRINNVFAAPGWHRITLRITPKAVDIRADDIRLIVPLAAHSLATWDADFRLALGNELTGKQPWLGDIREARVRVDAVSYDYLAPGALVLPEQLVLSPDRLRVVTPFMHTAFKRVVAVDWLLNLTGFLPFGWLVSVLYGPRRGPWTAIVLAALISLAIEAGQLLVFADRIPSSEDLILNTLGAALGTRLALRWRYRSGRGGSL